MKSTLLKNFIRLCILAIILCLFLFSLNNNRQSIQNFKFSLNKLMPVNETTVDSLNIPEFQHSLWRSEENFKDDNRFHFQQQWAVNLTKSEFIKNVKKKKRILVTGLFNLDDNERKLPCAEPEVDFSSHCELIEDLWYDPRYPNYDDFDAVLIRRDWNYQFYEPKVPPSKQTFFHIQESPYTLHQGDFRVNNPILASYWRGSDIFVPYYKWVPFKEQTTQNSQTIKNYAAGKTKFAAMIASHCPTYNNRLGFVKELQEFIPVDVYGKCGPHSCDGNCLVRVQQEYKFYLAFENANCEDYITEKFFVNSLQAEILPVVLGAQPSDYKFAAPPNSYIHVEDFPTIKSLAEYLILVDKNDTMYNEYFHWKGTGNIVGGHDDIFCRVCAFLFYSDFKKPPKWPTNASSWLNVNPCLKPGEHYWFRNTKNSSTL